MTAFNHYFCTEQVDAWFLKFRFASNTPTLPATKAVSKNKEKRLAELKMKDTLTDAEMEELIQLSPSGTFKSGSNLFTIGVIDVDNFSGT